jgi:predicted Zn-dependent peptidase
VAIGYRVADPVTALDELLAQVLLAEILTDGDSSRLQQRLVHREHLVTDIGAYLGEFGDPFDERDPTTFTITAHYPDAASLDRILAGIDAELAGIAEHGLEPGELDRVRTRLVSVLLRELDAVMSRTLAIARFALVHGRPELVNEITGRLSAITEEQVRAAAGGLTPDRRAVLEVIAGGTR